MRIDLLPRNTARYKANLHTHTHLSDGHKTPAEIKRDYQAHGYSVIAFTDHDKYYDHQDLTDERFIALNGFELEYYVTPWRQKTCHLCFIAKEPDNPALGWSEAEPPIFIRELPANALNPEQGGELYRVTCPGRKYNAEYINADIRRAKELGFFVTYNHPTWSLEHWPDYSRYRGMDAMEVVNYGCVAAGYDDDNGHALDDLLMLNNRIRCIASDDNHNDFPDEDPRSDSYGGYTVLAAQELSYGAVIRALEQGHFYSCGKVNAAAGECPQIVNLWLEDGKVFVECDGAQNIRLIKNCRPFSIRIAEAGSQLTGAEFDVGACDWFRLELTGLNGCKAFTNAYFMDELVKESD